MNLNYWAPDSVDARAPRLNRLMRSVESRWRHRHEGEACQMLRETLSDTACVAGIVGGDWVTGVELKFDGHDWRVVQIQLRPLHPAVDAPSIDPDFMSRAVAAVEAQSLAHRARDTSDEGALARSEFIDRNLEGWRDKRRKKSNFEYAALASKYAAEVRGGNVKATTAVAALVGVSSAVAAQWIKEARRRGLLSPGQTGRASGELTALGILYTDPSFPGFEQLIKSGADIATMAGKYGVSAADVQVAVEAEMMPTS